MDNLIKLIKKARFIFVCGNGGSAATAEHFVTDLIKKRYPAVCLSSNASVMSMIANDYGFEHVFSQQLEALGDKTDLLITISCSGTSANIREVQVSGMKIGMTVFRFKVFDKDRDFAKLENKHLQFAHEVAKAL